MKKKSTLILVLVILAVAIAAAALFFGSSDKPNTPTITPTAVPTENLTPTAEPTVEPAETLAATPTPTPEPTATPVPTSTPTPTPKPQYTFTSLDAVMYAVDAAGVRNLPSEEGNELGSLEKGEMVTVTAQCNETGWYEILYKESFGYVAEDSLTDVKPATPTPTPTPTSTPTPTPTPSPTPTSTPTPTPSPTPTYTFKEMDATMYAVKDTTVWDVPYEGGEIVTTLDKDDKVQVSAQCNETGYYKVTVNKKTGYVSEDSLTADKPVTPVPTEAPKEEEVKLGFLGEFETLTITEHGIIEQEIKLSNTADNVTVECKVSKETLLTALVNEVVAGSTYQLQMEPVGNGITSVTLRLYTTDESGTKTLHDSVTFTVKISVVEEDGNDEPVVQDTWYADIVADYPYKMHEWQYGEDIMVSIWSRDGRWPEGTEKRTGTDEAIMIVDGTGAMWSLKEARELGKHLNSTGNASVPWTDWDYSNYVQSTYEAHIAEGVTHIEQLGMARLEYVSLPSTLKSVGRSCFENSKLTEIILPEGVERLEIDAFCRCNNVAKIILPSTLKYIGAGAFGLDATHISRNKNLVKEVVIPEGVEFIGYGAFHYRYDIEIIVPENLSTSNFEEDWDILGD